MKLALLVLMLTGCAADTIGRMTVRPQEDKAINLLKADGGK